MNNKLNLLVAALVVFSSSWCNAQKKQISGFIPNGYSLFEKYKGDLNNDDLEDVVLIVKDTKKENVIINRFGDEVDRNRRGIIVLFNKENNYELAVENLNCFSSENEDGGVYFAPELWLNIENNNLKIHYGHGRYGYREYIFKYDESAFRLIGYESSENRGPVVLYKTSINFLTRKKLISKNTNQNSENEDEVFDETWYRLNIDNLIRLCDIDDFDELDLSKF